MPICLHDFNHSSSTVPSLEQYYSQSCPHPSWSTAKKQHLKATGSGLCVCVCFGLVFKKSHCVLVNSYTYKMYWNKSPQPEAGAVVYSVHWAGLYLVFHCFNFILFKGAFLMKQKGIKLCSHHVYDCKFNQLSNIQKKEIH